MSIRQQILEHLSRTGGSFDTDRIATAIRAQRPQVATALTKLRSAGHIAKCEAVAPAVWSITDAGRESLLSLRDRTRLYREGEVDTAARAENLAYLGKKYREFEALGVRNSARPAPGYAP